MFLWFNHISLKLGSDAGSGEDKKRGLSEDKNVDETESKKRRTESPTAAATEADTTIQEKDTFSDISDDVDDILNQEVIGEVDI